MKALWEKLPKEVKVALYVGVSAFLAEVIKYFQVTQADNLVVMAVVNIVIVLLQTRIPQIREKLARK